MTINKAMKQVWMVRDNGGTGDYSKCVEPVKEFNGKSMYSPASHPIVWTVVDAMCLPFMDSRFSEWRVQQGQNNEKWNEWFHENCKMKANQASPLRPWSLAWVIKPFPSAKIFTTGQNIHHLRK